MFGIRMHVATAFATTITSYWIVTRFNNKNTMQFTYVVFLTS
jgi:hypothetical protein